MQTIFTTTVEEMLKDMQQARQLDNIINAFASRLQNDELYARERFVDSPEWRKVITDIYIHNFNGDICTPVSESIRHEIKDFLDGNGFIIEDIMTRVPISGGGWGFDLRWHIQEIEK